MTRHVCRLLFAPTLMVAFASLVKGYAGSGDGFAAGIVAGLAFLMQFVAFGQRQVRQQLHTKYAPAIAVIGLVLALTITFVPVLQGKPILTQEPPPDSPVIHLGAVEIITAFAFDIGVFLLVAGFSVTVLSLVARAETREPR
jgi:multicomponent Na+:H+ antiporter subunit B